MNALLNGKELGPEAQSLLLNRGFRYGDGCFETMLVYQGSCPLLALHLQRLQKSLKALKLEWPTSLQLEEQLLQLKSNEQDWQRVRLWIWRSGEGLYTPQRNAAAYALSAEPATPPTYQVQPLAQLSQEVQLTAHRWSFIKSIGAQAYVMAGIEKQEKKADVLLLLNQEQIVTEASSANLFFKKRNRWLTPALECGCVAGVMRRYLMQQLLQKGEPVYEVHATVKDLLTVEKLVCTNVTGLQAVQQLQDKRFDTDVEELRSLLPAAYQTVS